MIYAFIFVVLLIVALLLGSLYAYKVAFYVSPKDHNSPPALPHIEKHTVNGEDPNAVITQAMDEMAALPSERVYITAHDGLRLAADYYHVADRAPLQIQLHGYRGSGVRDFCGGNRLARQMGHNTLVIHQRAHGNSDGRSITFGLMERYDCRRWAEYAAERFGPEVKIVLAGVSMGAATALMASSLPLPPNVVGIVADSPYTSAKEIIMKVCEDRGLPSRLAYPFVRLGAQLFGGFRLTAEGCCDAVKQTNLPILLIHGADDDFVPPEMSAEIQRHAEAYVRRELFPDASHGVSYIIDPDRYKTAAEEFIQLCLGAASAPTEQ